MPGKCGRYDGERLLGAAGVAGCQEDGGPVACGVASNGRGDAHEARSLGRSAAHLRLDEPHSVSACCRASMLDPRLHYRLLTLCPAAY